MRDMDCCSEAEALVQKWDAENLDRVAKHVRRDRKHQENKALPTPTSHSAPPCFRLPAWLLPPSPAILQLLARHLLMKQSYCCLFLPCCWHFMPRCSGSPTSGMRRA